MRSRFRAGFAMIASEVASNAMDLAWILPGESIRRTAEVAAQTAGNLRRIVVFGAFGSLS